MSGYFAVNLENRGENGERLLNNNNNNNGTGQAGEGNGFHEMTGSLQPNEELLLAVKSNDEPRLAHALEHVSPEDLNHIFPYPDSCGVLHLAALNNFPGVVRMLLERGAHPNLRDERGRKFTALHHATQIGSAEVIQILLERGADVNAKEGEFGRTCLHLLALKRKSHDEGLDKALKELLKQKKINIDRQDNNGATPLYFAARNGWEHMAKTLIMKGAKLDTKVDRNSVSDMLNKKLPGLLESINEAEIEQTQRNYGDDLYEALREEQLDLFKKVLSDINDKEKTSKKIFLEEDHGEYTLLNFACDNGLHEFVDVLLKEDADTKHFDRSTGFSPILYAAKNGFHKIMESLVEKMREKKGDLKAALRMRDKKEETALHKVVKREQPQNKEGVDYSRCLEILLSHKDCIDINAQDICHNTPLHYAVLCDDQSFVRDLLIEGAHLGIKNKFGTLAITRIQPSVLEEVLNYCVDHKKNVNDKDFEITLRYSMLAPSTIDYNRPETDCLKFLSRSRPHRHLLRHPIMDTFLFLKWQKIKHYYYFNLIAYAIFLVLLTTYILLFFGTIKKNLMEGNVEAGWVESQNSTNSESVLETNNWAKTVFQILILIFGIFGFIRELIQLSVSPTKYRNSLENWLELSILTMTIIILFIPVPYTSLQGISAWLILSSWVELVLILGRHPEFAVYITMFTTVTFNFLKFILMFSFVIIAFSLSFYLVFQIDDNFISYPKTLLKTIAMSTGEIEYSDLPLNDFPISSHLLFVIFVFLIVLVLMNLLNGLAVSDIQLIRQEAEIVSYRSRVELIAYIENVFLANPQLQQSSGKSCDFENCCFRTCFTTSNPILRILNNLGKKTLMFCNCLKERKITMHPNKMTERWHVCSCHKFDLEESQIEAAKSVVLSKNVKIADRLAGLEDGMDSVMQAVRTLTDMVQGSLIKTNVPQ